MSRELRVAGKPGESEDATLARTVLRPTVQAGISFDNLASEELPKYELQNLVLELCAQVDAVKEGELERADEMLVAQAHTLDAIFHSTLRRGASYLGGNSEVAERYLKLALKAQNQCRSTWQALAAIKHPPTTNYVHQANVAHVQQVNNQLKESDVGMESRATQAAGATHPLVETVGKLDRPKIG